MWKWKFVFGILGVCSSNAWKSYSLSLVRVVLMIALVVTVSVRTPLHQWSNFFMSEDPEFYVPPKEVELLNKWKFMWEQATLHQDLGNMTQFITRFAPGWMKEPLKQLMNVNAGMLSGLGVCMLLLCAVVYVIGLVFRLLVHLVCRCSCLDNPIPDKEVSRLAKGLAETDTKDDVTSFIEAMNRDTPLEVKQLKGCGCLATQILRYSDRVGRDGGFG